MSAAAPGSPAAAPQPVTHGRVLRIALPIILSNLTVPLLGAVDTGVVGQLGQAELIGAVGLGATLLAAIYWLFGFLRMGTTGLTAQAVGAGDRTEVAAHLWRALLVGLSGGLLLVLLQPLLIGGALALSPAGPEVEMLARDYLAIRIWTAPAAIALFGINGWLIGQERTGAVLAVQLGMNGLNVALDLWFVLALGWGVRGVAAATALSELAGCLWGLWLCRAAFCGRIWRERARLFAPAPLRRMAAVNRDILVRGLLIEAVFVAALFQGAAMGDVTLAANQVLMQFLTLSAYALDGFAFAAETLVGQAFGARMRGMLTRALHLAALWGAGGAALLSLGFLLAGPRLIDLMTTAPDVRLAARIWMPWAALAPLSGVAAFMLDGAFVGATRTRDMRDMMALAVILYFAALWPLVRVFGNHGLWAALHLSLVARALFLGLRFPALLRAAGQAG
ncbi:putative efflux protein, MATE family [Rubellimicrobium thermophilum DSM 16684]|uniref:Putative efflux protein, MATE family n=1 Tax=Rubellimicrobium thermophilum DSM 16684 TaxID=1123069 RepID=S9R682_9RHOB|nr:MATE family efflux transporter [Rubellimicrobium thermophilum]EPX87422.1 putative efflux protein, MATE family [Rubellimicrobium thermophilum DSM 16684]